MENMTKFTSITGEPAYIRGGYNILAIAEAVNGDIRFTEIHIPGMVFRIRETAEEVANKFGWDMKAEV